MTKDSAEENSKKILLDVLKRLSKVKSMKNTFVQFYNRVVNIQKAWRVQLGRVNKMKSELLERMNEQLSSMRNRLFMSKPKHKKTLGFLK